MDWKRTNKGNSYLNLCGGRLPLHLPDKIQCQDQKWSLPNLNPFNTEIWQQRKEDKQNNKQAKKAKKTKKSKKKNIYSIIFGCAVVNMASAIPQTKDLTKRKDYRHSHQMRAYAVEHGTIIQADGSAKFSHGMS